MMRTYLACTGALKMLYTGVLRSLLPVNVAPPSTVENVTPSSVLDMT
jgi:hypothetical protein